MSRNPKKANKKNAGKKDIKNKGESKEKILKKKKVKKIILITVLVLVSLAIIGAGILIGVFFGMFGDELKLEKKDLIIGIENSKVLDKNGELISVVSGSEKRQIISMSDMPEYLPKAYVAIEDERFEKHHGVDIKRTLGAIVSFVFNKGESSYGGSTITQQLVKNLTEDDDARGFQGIIRKAKEWARAYNVEKLLSKSQILELYLNILYVGGANYHGVELGAKYYFDKSAKDVTLAEAAYMAGINNGPQYYDAFSTEEKMVNKIKNKTKVVLKKMKDLGYIENEEDYNKAVEETENGLPFKKGTVTTSVLSYHTEAAMTQVIKDYMKEKGCSKELAETYVYGSGLTIQTTQDTAIQKIIEEEYAKDSWKVNSKINKNEDGTPKTIQSATVIMDHKTGYVVGTVGGLGAKTTNYNLNRALTGYTRPTGSSMKPLAAIAPALEKGILTAGKVYDDVPYRYPNTSIEIKNHYSGYKGLSTVRNAIKDSQNPVPVKILVELGLDNSIKFLESIGITSLKDEGLAMALGGLTYGVSPLEMAGAYSMIANNGLYIEPTFYTKVIDGTGETVLEAKQNTLRAMSEANAYILQDILKTAVTSGTATHCAIPGMDTGAKTGTTTDDYDRWLCGFTPYYTSATWFGFDINETVPRAINGVYLNPGSVVFKNVMSKIHKDLPNAKFVAPKNIVRATICSSSGLLATEECKHAINGNCAYSEIFAAGTQPKKTCDVHVKAKVHETEPGKYVLANEWCKDAREVIFITRPNSDKNTAWRSAADAKFMLPTEYCTVHKEPEKEPEKKPDDKNTVDPNKPGNNTGGNNTGGNNTSGNNTGGNNTGGNNTSGNNTTNNNTTNNNTVDTGGKNTVNNDPKNIINTIDNGKNKVN